MRARFRSLREAPEVPRRLRPSRPPCRPSSRSPVPPADRDMGSRLARKLLVIGWDAADWQLIDPLVAKGAMPTLARLVSAGVRSDLGTLDPKLSPLLWTSIATGKTADKHGILNFVEPKPDGSGLRLASSTSRKCKAIWNILSQSELHTNVIGWYASHPAEPIRGSVVTNLICEGNPAQASAPWPVPPALTHPPECAEAIAACRVRSTEFERDSLKEILPDLPPGMRDDPRVRTLCSLMAVAASVERAASHLMRAGPWDCTMAFFETIDTVGHHFMQYRPPRMRHVKESEVRAFGGVMDRVYRWHDAALARMLDAAGPDVTVVLLSDHGFHSDRHRPVLADLPPERRMEREASWHRPTGVLVMSGTGVAAGQPPVTASILDVAPTVLALLGVAVGADFDGRCLSESLEGKPAPDRIESWEGVEGDAGLHPAEVRQDPFEAADALKQLVDLGYMAALPEDVQGQLDLVRRESAFNLGMSLLSRGRFAEALPRFAEIAQARPEEYRYAICLATCLASTGDFSGAASALEAVLARDASAAEARLLHARCLHALGRADDARRESDRVSRELRAHPNLAPSLADALLREGRTQESLQLYRRIAKEDPKSIPALLGVARCQLEMERWDEAASAALDAMDVHKAVPDGHYLLALALAWTGDMPHARQSAELGLTFDPRHAPMLWLAAVLA
ncbi:MAG: tetratricopeptide repeat protein, partial [Phycisphaerales bacterium]|nr:tetratricopeptide repeat protein [Phycisphaerales bacterium]